MNRLVLVALGIVAIAIVAFVLVAPGGLLDDLNPFTENPCQGVTFTKYVTSDIFHRTATWQDVDNAQRRIEHRGYWDRQEWLYFGSQGGQYANLPTFAGLNTEVDRLYIVGEMPQPDWTWYRCIRGSVDE